MSDQLEVFVNLLKKSKDPDLLMAVDWVLDNGGNVEGVVEFCEEYITSIGVIRMENPQGILLAFRQLLNAIEPHIHPSIMANDHQQRIEWIIYKMPHFARERLTGTRNSLLMGHFISDYRNQTVSLNAAEALVDGFLLQMLSCNKIDVLAILCG